VKCHGQSHDGSVLALIGREKNAVGKERSSSEPGRAHLLNNGHEQTPGCRSRAGVVR
jgi:hypothetical protein